MNRMRIMPPAPLALTMLAMLVLFGGRAEAWGEKGHLMINRLAAEAMPAETPAFFKNAVERLAYLGPEPDRWKVDSGPQLNAVNGPDHYMDMEPVADLTLPNDRYKYFAMVEEKGLRAKDLPAEKLGFLPYRIAELTQRLQSQWRDWKAAKDGTAEKSQIEQGIIFTAGVLGHYVADSANPHHTTIHHNGWDTSFAPNPKGYTTAEAERAKRPDGFHHRFEGEFVESKISAADVRPLLTPLSPVSRVFDDTVAFLKASNAQVDRLYALEKANAFRTSGEADPEGLRFARERMAAGASRLRDIWAASMQGTAPYQRNRSRTPSTEPAAPTAGATPSTRSGQPAGK